MRSLMSVVEGVPSASSVQSRSSDTLSVIIVLGCPPFKKQPLDTSLTHRGELDATFVARVKKGAEVYYSTPGRKVIIPTGYQSTGFRESEAAAMKTLLLEQNICSDNIIVEEEANSTVQNAIKCRHIVRKLMESNDIVNIIVVTSSFHMQRSRYIFSRLFHCGSFQLHFEESEDNIPDSVLQSVLKTEEKLINNLKAGYHSILEKASKEKFDNGIV